MLSEAATLDWPSAHLTLLIVATIPLCLKRFSATGDLPVSGETRRKKRGQKLQLLGRAVLRLSNSGVCAQVVQIFVARRQELAHPSILKEYELNIGRTAATCQSMCQQLAPCSDKAFTPRLSDHSQMSPRSEVRIKRPDFAYHEAPT